MQQRKRPDYNQYMKSIEWARRRRRSLENSGYQCQHVDHRGRCPDINRLQVHHLTYDRLGAELDDDLIVYCRLHHVLAHLLQKRCRKCEDSVFDTAYSAEKWIRWWISVDRHSIDSAIHTYPRLCLQCKIEVEREKKAKPSSKEISPQSPQP